MTAFLALVVFVVWLGVLLIGDAIVHLLVDDAALERFVDRVAR